MLTVGVPTEVKNNENRVAITPDGVRELHLAGRARDRRGRGGRSRRRSPTRSTSPPAPASRPTPETTWGEADLVCKVKEPQPDEGDLMRDGLVLFTYLHLAAYPEVAKALLGTPVTGVAYETVQTRDRRAPAARADERGRGTAWRPRSARTSSSARTAAVACCSAARPACGPARVVVIGAGNVGWNAAWIAAGMEAEVVLLDKNLDRLRWVDQIHQGRIMTLASNRGSVERAGRRGRPRDRGGARARRARTGRRHRRARGRA